MLTNELIGKKFPVKDQDDNIVQYKTIKWAIELSNYAAVVIGLTDDKNSGIFINYNLANDIVSGQNNNGN